MKVVGAIYRTGNTKEEQEEQKPYVNFETQLHTSIKYGVNWRFNGEITDA
jgi:hypothetical protein